MLYGEVSLNSVRNAWKWKVCLLQPLQGFTVANDHGSSTVILCWKANASPPPSHFLCWRKADKKEGSFSLCSRWWFLPEGVLTACYGSFFFPSLQPYLEKSCIKSIWCRKPALKGFKIPGTIQELLLFVISCSSLRWLFISAVMFEIWSRI